MKPQNEMTDEELVKLDKIVFYKSNYGFPLNRWDSFTNWLWYWVAERNQLWAKVIYYPLNWLEQRKFDLSCLMGRHFYINSDTECERCGKHKV
jgi:hypothetical protein